MTCEEAEVLLLLIGNTITDLLCRKIALKFTAAFTAIGAVLFWRENGNLYNLLPGLVISVLVIGMGVVSRGGIGCGDGLVMAVMALFLDDTRYLFCISAAFLLSFAVSIILFIGKKDRRASFPFVPCLMAGTVIIFLCGS